MMINIVIIIIIVDKNWIDDDGRSSTIPIRTEISINKVPHLFIASVLGVGLTYASRRVGEARVRSHAASTATCAFGIVVSSRVRDRCRRSMATRSARFLQRLARPGPPTGRESSPSFCKRYVMQGLFTSPLADGCTCSAGGGGRGAATRNRDYASREEKVSKRSGPDRRRHFSPWRTWPGGHVTSTSRDPDSSKVCRDSKNKRATHTIKRRWVPRVGVAFTAD